MDRCSILPSPFSHGDHSITSSRFQLDFDQKSSRSISISCHVTPQAQFLDPGYLVKNPNAAERYETIVKLAEVCYILRDILNDKSLTFSPVTVSSHERSRVLHHLSGMWGDVSPLIPIRLT